jgi:hypothetical protein
VDSTQSSHVQSLSISHRLPLGLLVQVRLDKRMRLESVWEAVSGSLDGVYFRVRVPTREP